MTEARIEDVVAGFQAAGRDYARVAGVAPYASHAEVLSAPKPSVQFRIAAMINGRLIEWIRQAGGTCLGGGWVPASHATAAHWGLMWDAAPAANASSLQAAVTWIATQGGTLLIHGGRYNLGGSISVANAARPFAIVGEGYSVLVRAANGVGSLISINNSHGWRICDLTLDAGFAEYPTNANHGMVWYNCNNIRVQRVNVVNWKNTALIGYTAPEAPDYRDNIIEDCVVDGGNNSNNGILLASLAQSGLLNCQALNIGKTGSPCYALQLKNRCQDGFIRGGRATGASVGIALGNYETPDGRSPRVSDVHIAGCTVGIAFGNMNGAVVSGLIIDQQDETTGSAIDFNLGSTNCSVLDARILNAPSNRASVYFRDGDTDNVVHITTISPSGSSPTAIRKVATFLAGSRRNTVRLDHYDTANGASLSASVDALAQYVESGFFGNSIQVTDMPWLRLSLVIAADAITLRDRVTRIIRLDTEANAASDDLSTINGGADGQIITISSTANARDVVVKHGTGNIRLKGAVDRVLALAEHTMTLVRNDALSAWVET